MSYAFSEERNKSLFDFVKLSPEIIGMECAINLVQNKKI